MISQNRRFRLSIRSFPFYRRCSKRSGHPAALGRVNLSRTPHCSAAFSLGNEVMETRLDLPFSHYVRRIIFTSFFSPGPFPFPLFLAQFRWFVFSSFPSSSSFPSTACHRLHSEFLAIVLGSSVRRINCVCIVQYTTI